MGYYSPSVISYDDLYSYPAFIFDPNNHFGIKQVSSTGRLFVVIGLGGVVGGLDANPVFAFAGADGNHTHAVETSGIVLGYTSFALG